ncbi:MAG: TAT-variant-translocated molybdopterin oxidoreductase [Polyangiaceae bacterium]
MSDSNSNTTQRPRFWRSLKELEQAPSFRAFLEREFPEAALAPLDGVGRRRFLQLMGASFALAGCRWDEEQILPFSRRPAGQIPGDTMRYRTALEVAGCAVGLEATTFDGRPVKLDGNPDHPASLGATSATLQARILELYDPERSQSFEQRGGSGSLTRIDREAFVAALRDALSLARASRGAGLAVVASASESPTRARLQAALLAALPEITWVDWEPFDRHAERAGTELAFGEPLRPIHDLAAARRIVCLDADPLGTHPMALANLRGWAAGRAPEEAGGEVPSRLYAVESTLSTTGANADHRLPLASSRVPAFAARLAAAVAERLGRVGPTVAGEAALPLEVEAWLKAVAEDLADHPHESLVIAGDGQPAEVHALAAWLNDALGAVGRTLRHVRAPHRPSALGGLRALAEKLRGGAIDSLLVLGANPVFEAPGDIDFAAAMRAAKTTFHVGLYGDETAVEATWHAPLAHPLTTWGDGRAFDGTITLQQPLIAPLYGGLSPLEVVAELAGQPDRSAEQLVRDTFLALTAGESDEPARDNALPVLIPAAPERRFRRALETGVVDADAYAVVTPSLRSARIDLSPAAPVADLELTIFDDGKVDAGRLANNAWLQETPETRTKLVWDNALLLGPATAAALGVTDEEVVRLEREGASLELPVYIMPGQAAGTGAVALGYGRRRAGTVGGHVDDGFVVGVDVAPLRRSSSPWLVTGLSLTKTGRRYRLATTQDHWAMDELGMKERERRSHHLVREVSSATYAAEPEVIHEMDHHPPLESLWSREPGEGHQWGMSIDLSKCVGCNACTVACQSENNIPVVGKDEVLNGREMHWLRIDRYFQGDPEMPRVAQQPVACAHCESAPCEEVCPVAATMHSHEGTNDMVYNRCIGTRYCANNCPYKVRRFNFLDYHEDLHRGGEANERVRLMVFNPDVTVRPRGVMEKCTYCTQRIKGAKHDARIDGRALRDGDVTPACAQACPTQAIVFGDVADPDAKVSRAHGLKRSYALLAELNIRPRTRYLARIINPNPALSQLEEKGA